MHTVPLKRSWKVALPVVLLGVAEVAVFIWAASRIGWWVLLIVMLTTVLGTVLLGVHSRASWRRLRESLSSGVTVRPASGAAFFGVLGAMLLILPGLIGNAAGLLLQLSPIQTALAARTGSHLSTRLKGGFTASTTSPLIIKGEVVDDDEAPESNIEGPVQLPQEDQ